MLGTAAIKGDSKRKEPPVEGLSHVSRAIVSQQEPARASPARSTHSDLFGDAEDRRVSGWSLNLGRQTESRDEEEPAKTGALHTPKSVDKSDWLSSVPFRC